MCLKGCAGWQLFYKEYHLHDKDGKPIRLQKNKKVKKAVLVIPEPQTGPAETAIPVSQLISTIVATHYHVTNVIEENMYSSNPLLFVLMVLLLLLLVIRMNRRREEG